MIPKTRLALTLKDEIAKNFGLCVEHQYLITNAASIQGRSYLRVHNPFNTHEHIKAWEDNSELEKMIVSLGYEELCAGEFWIDYDSFVDKFKSVKVCNLNPDKSKDLKMADKSLKSKTTLLTQWSVKTFQGVLPAMLRKIKYCK